MFTLRILLLATVICILGVEDLRSDDIITIEEVMSNPSIYHGSRITLTGFFAFDFERSAIFSEEKRERGKPLSSAIWVSLEQGRIPSYVYMGYGSYCVISGVFSMYNNGHLGAYHGGISEVSFLDCDIDEFEYEDIAGSRNSALFHEK